LFGFCETVMARMYFRRQTMKTGSAGASKLLSAAGVNLMYGDRDARLTTERQDHPARAARRSDCGG
jgi:hypothetical protein